MADKKSFLLRLSPDLWEELNRWARDELRSVNAQIEYLLRQSVKKRRGASASEELAEIKRGDKPAAGEPLAAND